MTRRRNVVFAVLLALLAATLAFIFFQSTRSPEDSSRESSFFLALLEPLLRPFLGTVDEHFIRKLAHFIEFCALGLELSGLVVCRRRLSLHMVLHTLFAALLCAAADETIQIFSGRGSQLPDVWLDFAAAALGIVLVSGIAALRRRAGRKNP